MPPVLEREHAPHTLLNKQFHMSLRCVCVPTAHADGGVALLASAQTSECAAGCSGCGPPRKRGTLISLRPAPEESLWEGKWNLKERGNCANR